MRRIREDNPHPIPGCTLDDTRLRDAVVALVAAHTRRRFAAVYPVTDAVVAINDGESIQTHRAEPLRRDVAAALVSGGGTPQVTWLLVDVDELSLRVVGVRAATECLAPSMPRTAELPLPWRDAEPARGRTIASRRRDDGAPGCG